MMNKKFIATFAAAAMLCCVCNAGVAVADDNTDFNATITQLISQADTHIDALKKITDDQNDDDLKKVFTDYLKSAKENKQNIQNAINVIEKFDRDLAAAGNNPNDATLQTLKDEHSAAESAQYKIFSGNNHNLPKSWSMPYSDPFKGYPDYSTWLKEAMSYGKISDANIEIAKLKNTKEKISTLVKPIKLPSEINPENIDDKCDREFKGEELRFWYDGEANASNSKYVAAQLDYWRKDVQNIKNNLKDKIAKSVRGLADDMKYDLENRIYKLTSKVEAAMNLHDGEEYLLKESKKYSNLEDVFKHNIMQYNNFGISQDQSDTPTDNSGFDYDTYNKLQEQIQNLYNEYYNMDSQFSTVMTDPDNVDTATRKAYLEFCKKNIEIKKKINALYEKQKALGEYPNSPDHTPTTDSSTARPGAISYAYLQLKFKKYVQNLISQGKSLEDWLAENKPAYEDIYKQREKEFGPANKVSYKTERSPKYFESFFKQHRYEFIRDLVASREYKLYVKNKLKENMTYAQMIEDTKNSLHGTNNDTFNKLYQRIDFIKHLQEYGNKDEVMKILDTDDLALTPEQESSKDLIDDTIPDFEKLSKFDFPHYYKNNPDGDTGNKPDNNPDDPFDGFNFDDIDWGDFNFDDLDLDDLGVDDVDAEDFDFSEFDTYASEISDDDLASLDIDDINFDDLDLGDLDLSDFYNDDTQSGDTQSGDTTNSGDTNAGNTAKPGETKLEDVAKPGDTANSGDAAKPGEITKPGDAKSSETIKPGDTKSAAAKIEAAKAEVAVDKTEDVKIEAAKSEFADAKSEDVKIEAAETDNDNAGDATQTDNVTKTQENNN